MSRATPVLIWLIGVASLAIPSYISLAAPWPQLWSPYSAILWLLWWQHPQGLWPYVVAPLTFVALTALTLVHRPPARAVYLTLVALVALLSIGWYLLSFSFGLRYEGPFHTIGLSLINAAFVGVGLRWLYQRRRQLRVVQQLLASWLFAAWLVTYAFPYLGEFP